MPNKSKIVREHDKLYLKEDRKHNPKEYFKFIAQCARPYLIQNTKLRILDIGCATGDFIFYMKSLYPDANCTGLEYLDELLYKAKEDVPNCTFIKGDICTAETLPSQCYDAVFMSGVHSIFNDLNWLENAVKLVKSPNGKLFVFGIFNPDDVDVLLQVRSNVDNDNANWQSGWNCFSMGSFSRALNKIGVQNYHFTDFNIEIDIPRHEFDPLRSWTFGYSDGSRGVINGTLLVHKLMLLEITV